MFPFLSVVATESRAQYKPSISQDNIFPFLSVVAAESRAQAKASAPPGTQDRGCQAGRGRAARWLSGEGAGAGARLAFQWCEGKGKGGAAIKTGWWVTCGLNHSAGERPRGACCSPLNTKAEQFQAPGALLELREGRHLAPSVSLGVLPCPLSVTSPRPHAVASSPRAGC